MDEKDIEEIHTKSVKEFFGHEERRFTPWLKEHIHKLSEDFLLGFELENVRREVTIEGYKADLVAVDPHTERTVIIENQFGDADPDHLGRSIMYAANKDADIIVWIAEHIEDAYANTLQMLNQRTDETFGIYGIEVSVIQIGDSPPYGIDFTPVVKPNNWQPPAADLSETDQAQQQFWEQFRQTLRDKNLDQFAGRSGGPKASYYVNIRGLSDTYIRPTANYNENRLHVIIRVYDRNIIGNNQLEDVFIQYIRETIPESSVGLDIDFAEDIEFEKTPENNFDKINIEYTESDVDLDDQDNWPEYHEWLADVTKVFNEAIEKLNSDGKIEQ